jgi:lipid A 3-O-deacylase
VRHWPALLLACLLAVSPALAEEPTLQDRIAEQVAKAKKRRFVTFNVENDLFGGGTDRNYTSGVRVTYFDLGAQPHPVFKNISRIFPTFTINKTTSIHYTLGQNLYTPKDITQVVQAPDDHPWAGFLYGSAGLTTITGNHVDEAEVTLGIVGPAALGRQTQTFIHKYISDSPKPMGWDNQLKNEPGIVLAWQRRWPGRKIFDAAGLYGGAEPHLGVTLGNIYTYANAGLGLRLSPISGRFQDDPIRVRPAMPGTGAFLLPEKTFSWYLFGGVEGRAVARNIFLDGNTFADSYSVDKKPFVADANAGLALTYGDVRMSYAVTYRTHEFDTQDGGNIFGTVSLGYRF